MNEKSNPVLVNIIHELRLKSHNDGVSVWKDIARRLSRPSRSWAEVNVGEIAKIQLKDESIIIPGKLLGAGLIDSPVTVAAFKVSKQAKDKIEKAGGRVMSIPELMDKNPKVSTVRIIG